MGIKEKELEDKISAYAKKNKQKGFYFGKLLVVVLISVLFSVMISVLFVRGCWGRGDRSYFGSLLCGDIGFESRSYHWLDMRKFSAISLGPQSSKYSLERGMGVEKLIDGLTTTLAYPAQRSLDYVVDFNGLYELTGAEFVFDIYGMELKYIDYWQLLGKDKNNEWKILAEGGFPGAKTVNRQINATVSSLRIKAESKENWIGIYELRAKGRIALQ